ncbi:hypothetical protein HK098_003173 [Nowakowskiella sp. JEL0407]|nr:hypothetical protein HK098_003173 [Nowakowskiella sp. JEL0407]
MCILTSDPLAKDFYPAESAVQERLVILQKGSEGDIEHEKVKSFDLIAMIQSQTQKPDDQIHYQRPQTAGTRITLGSSTISSNSRRNISSASRPPESPAVKKIKANALIKEKISRNYIKQYTTSPSAPASARTRSKVLHSRDDQRRRHSAGGHSKLITLNKAVEYWDDYVTSTSKSHKYCAEFSNNPSLQAKQVDLQLIDSYSSNNVSKSFKIGSTLPRPPGLPTHTPFHTSSYPIGAHSHGFYSKQQQAALKPSVATTSISKLLKDETTKKQNSNKNNKSENSSPNAKYHFTEIEIQDEVELKVKKFSHPVSAENLESHLGILTDMEFNASQIAETLNWLMGAVGEDNKNCLTVFDMGAIPILLNLMQRTINFPDLQLKICNLLQLLVTGNDIVATSILKQNGIPLLLNAVNIVANANSPTNTEHRLGTGTVHHSNLTVSRSTSKLTNRITKKLPLSRTGSTNLTMSNASLGSSENADDLHKSVELISGHDEKLFKSNDNAGESLITGLLSKYFEPRFFDQVEKMDKTTRSQIIKHLLVLFEKVDKLLTVSSYISLDLNVERSMEEVMDEAGEIMQAQLILLYMIDPETKELILKEFNVHLDPKAAELLPIVSFPPGTGIAGWVAQNEQTLNVRDAQSNDKFDPDIDVRGENIDAHSILCVPIKTRDNVTLGVLLAVNKIGQSGQWLYFNQEDEYLLRKLGRQAGIILKNAEMYDTMKKTQRKVEVLLETTRMLSSTVEINTLVKLIMDAAKDLLTADRCSLFLADEEQKQLRGHIQYRDSIQEIALSMDKGIAAHVYTTAESVNIPEAFNSDVDKQTGYITHNMLCMPIKNISGKAIGVTQMINKKSGHFIAEDEQILSSFSAQAAVAIEKSYLFKKTEDMRAHLQSILSSITSCVITLSSSMKMETQNRDWVMTALGVTEEQMRTTSIDKWIGSENGHLLEDILHVYESGQSAYSAEYELKEPRGTGTFVNYQIMPLIGAGKKGVVLVFENISSEKRAIMTLGRYMSPSLAKQVMMEDGSQLGGTRKKVAILFSDIRSFTTLSESMDPHEVVELLNHHFSDAVNAITEEQGNI